jgi:hypothetical protein
VSPLPDQRAVEASDRAVGLGALRLDDALHGAAVVDHGSEGRVSWAQRRPNAAAFACPAVPSAMEFRIRDARGCPSVHPAQTVWKCGIPRQAVSRVRIPLAPCFRYGISLGTVCYGPW